MDPQTIQQSPPPAIPQPSSFSQTPQPAPARNNKPIIIGLCAILLLIGLIFIILLNRNKTKPVLNSSQTQNAISPSPKLTFTPKTSEVKSSTELYDDIKKQLINAFK